MVAVTVPFGGYITAELDLAGIFASLYLEGISVLEPVVRGLYLEAVLDLLAEQTVAVSDAAAIGRIIEGGQGIQEAGRKSAQSSVSKGRIPLLILYKVEVNSQLIKSLPDLLIASEIDEVIAQGTSLKELHGKIVELLGVLLLYLLMGVDPVINDPFLDHS